MKAIKLFVPIIWLIISLYILSFLMDMMNMANTVAFTLGFLGIVLIIYLSFITQLGLKLITKKTK